MAIKEFLYQKKNYVVVELNLMVPVMIVALAEQKLMPITRMKTTIENARILHVHMNIIIMRKMVVHLI